MDRAIDSRDGYALSKSKKEKERYSKTLGELVQELMSNVEKAQAMYNKMKEDRDSTQIRLDDLISKERNYFRILSDFHKECMRNQELRELTEGAQSSA